MIRRKLLIATFAVIATVGVSSHGVMGNAPATIPFNHKYHLEDVGADCATCHKQASSATSAATMLLPKLQDCYACHEAANEKWPTPADTAAPWPAPRTDLNFDHSKHIALGLDCVTCHSEVKKAEKSPSHALPAMSLCIDCHTKREVATSCNTCHTQVALLRPKDHGPDWIVDHPEVARGDAGTCENCHTQTYCSECHEGAALGMNIKNLKDAPVEKIGPLSASLDGAKPLILERAHDLNYRYTHGADVRAKTTDCAQCHEAETFCNACHRPENDASRIRPVWHDLADFKFYKHADYARRDIEVCAGCHDPSGADPSCLQCHRTTRSPHPDGFMRDVKGSWHDDDNAVCFVCHDAGTRSPGVGFCGKCHGRNPN
jgi:hypothetical protein